MLVRVIGVKRFVCLFVNRCAFLCGVCFVFLLCLFDCLCVFARGLNACVCV